MSPIALIPPVLKINNSNLIIYIYKIHDYRSAVLATLDYYFACPALPLLPFRDLVLAI